MSNLAFHVLYSTNRMGLSLLVRQFVNLPREEIKANLFETIHHINV